MASTSHLIQIRLALKDEASASLDKANSGLKQLGSQLTSLGSQMTAAFTLPIVAAGTAAVNMAMDLDKSMRNIQSISKQTNEEIAALSDTFVEMSTDISKTTDSAQNLADAFYQIQGSGFAGADAMQVLEVATKAASAGLTTTAVAAEGIVAVLNSYGLSAEHASEVSDIMFETVNRGVGSYEELSASMSNVVGLANALGVPFEEVSAAMATMSKQGFSFAEASVAINQAMSNLLQPTAEGQKIIEAMGYASGQAMIDALGFAGSIQAIAEHTGGSAEEMGKLFSNVRGLRAALALTGDGAQMFSEDLQAMAVASGATAEAFAIQTQSFDAAWKNFQNTLNAMLIEVGQVLLPVLTGFMQQVLIPLIQGFRSLPAPVQQFVIGLLAILAAVGPILIILGMVAGAVLQLKALFVAFPAIAGIFSAAFSPIVILIGLIIAGIVLLITHWEQLGTTISQLGTIIDQATGGFFSRLLTTLSQIGQLVMKAWQQMGTIAWDFGVAIIMGLINGIKSKAVDLIAYVFGLSEELTSVIKQVLGISSPSKVMMGLGENVVQGFQKGMDNLGGLDVGVTANGRPVSSASPSLAMAGAGGGSVTYNNYFTLPPGSDRQTVDRISKELGKQAQRKGAQKYR